MNIYSALTLSHMHSCYLHWDLFNLFPSCSWSSLSLSIPKLANWALVLVFDSARFTGPLFPLHICPYFYSMISFCLEKKTHTHKPGVIFKMRQDLDRHISKTFAYIGCAAAARCLFVLPLLLDLSLSHFTYKTPSPLLPSLHFKRIRCISNTYGNSKNPGFTLCST